MRTSSMMRTVLFLLTAALITAPAGAAPAKKKKSSKPAAAASASSKETLQVMRLFDFETDLDGWRIPDWAFAKKDNAAVDVSLAEDQASNGKKSLKINCNFPPKMWSGAYVEIERESGNFMDFTGHQYLLVDIFLPPEAPKLKGEIILTVGENWAWTEMRQPVMLTPGQWTTVKADITPDGTAWKVRLTSELASDVRKLGVRVSSSSPEYKGPVYIDNIRLGSLKKK